MSDGTFTRNELFHLESFGPDSKVCRTGSNAWRSAKYDPALADFFETDEKPAGESNRESTADNLRFIPRYFRLFAFIVDSVLIVGLILLLSLLPRFRDLFFRSYCLLGFVFGAVYFTVLESGFHGGTTLGKYLNGVKLFFPSDVDLSPDRAFVRYGLIGLPLLLLGIAYDPGLPHDAYLRKFSLVFGLVGIVPLVLNIYLFYFNDPTYRLIQDYLAGTWIVPRSTEIVPGEDYPRNSHWVPLGLTGAIGLGIALVGWILFWDLKHPPVMDVPAKCEISPERSYVSSTSLIDRSRLRDRLMNGDYREVERRLGILQSEYESGQNSDVPLDYAMGVFGVVDPEVGRRINEWIIQNPDSPFALLARTEYYFRRGMVKKRLHAGSRPDTGVWSSIQSDLQQARISLEKARNLNPDLSVALSLSIRLHRIDPSGSSLDLLLERARNLPRPSVVVWNSLLIDTHNRPVGSLEAARARLKRLRSSLDKQRALNLFCGILAQHKAASYQRKGRYETADKYYSQALLYGRSPWVYARRGLNANRRNRPVEGIQFFEKALEILPGQSEVLRQMARIQFEEGFYSQSLDAITLALNRESRHPELLYLYARILKRIGKPSRALNQVSKAKKFAPGWSRLNELELTIAESTDQP